MSLVSFFSGGGIATMGRLAGGPKLALGIYAAIHLVALGVMLRTETGPFSQSMFLLIWALLNCIFLLLLRRPVISAALSLALIATTIVLSNFKFTILWMTINFFDLLIIDSDTVAFLLSIFPDLRSILIVGGLIALPVFVLVWRLDPFRVRRPISTGAGAACAVVIGGLSLAVPEEPWEQFQGVNHISAFVRSGVTTGYELATKGWIDFDSTTSDQLRASAHEPCHAASRPPHIIMVLDEASFDATAIPGVKVPPGYHRHFQSFDGKQRTLTVEGSGGPTWYTEYNVLTGLSARSYGRLSFYVTRIAADRVKRGLPQALRRCGYKTVSLYPAYGAFLNARRFQATTGVDRFIDADEMKAGELEPDRFFYNQALDVIERDRSGQPLFLFVYTIFNHFPWWTQLRPELTPDWQSLGNHPEIDEYLRRQTLSARDYVDFKDRLQKRFPGESFLIVRFGDHQPGLSAKLLDPSATDTMIAQRIMAHDPRYFSTYYAVDGINYRPSNMSSALDRLEAPYLPLVLQEAAGLPLDPTFVEQKKILLRCHGVFFGCAGGAEARRFNRLLIDAGLIKGLVSR